MKRSDASHVLESVQRARVVIVGDVILDEYVTGSASRLSPEAPVPVVDVAELRSFPGGAANVARNAAGIGADVVLIGVIGEDDDGARLEAMLGGEGGPQTILVRDPMRPTTKKTRVVASGHQIVRFDHELRKPLSEAVAARVMREVQLHLGTQCGALILSDYHKGVLSDPVLRACIDGALACGVPCVIDPKRRDLQAYRGATLLTPNLAEARAAAGVAANASTEALLASLVSALDTAVLVTEGEAGMTLQTPGSAPVHMPARLRQVFDRTGAGDTVVAVLSAALAGGASMLDAAELANAAAGVAVSKPGVVAVDPVELLHEFE